MASKTQTRKNRRTATRATAKQETTPVAATEPTPEVAVATPADKPEKAPIPAKTPVEADRLAVVLANARPAESNCLCGCGNLTKGRFFPGHDAVLKAQLGVTARLTDDARSADAQAALAKFGWA